MADTTYTPGLDKIIPSGQIIAFEAAWQEIVKETPQWNELNLREKTLFRLAFASGWRVRNDLKL